VTDTLFELHRARGPFNAAFFSVMGPYIERNVRDHKRRVYAELPDTVVHLDLRDSLAERTDLPDQSADSVISSLVLCTVANPADVLAEIRRILRPGGTFRFVEHVAATAGTPTRTLQRALRRPWAWAFEGCSCERDLAGLLRNAGFARVDIEPYRLHTPFVPFNTQIAGIAYA
jgi:SAM-dependent methyltransferase